MDGSTQAFTLNISYSQVAVFLPALQQPFSVWTQEHVNQGFAWRPGTAAFRTLVEAGVHSVHIRLARKFPDLRASAVRAIEVPLRIPAEGSVEIASVSDSVALKFPPGDYGLRCEFSDDDRIDLTFASDEEVRFRIARADPQLSPSSGLLTSANPA